MKRLALALLLLAGCAFAPTLPAADELMAENCQFIGQVTGHSRWGWGLPAQLERAHLDATEQAQARGDAHVVCVSVTAGLMGAVADARAYGYPK